MVRKSEKVGKTKKNDKSQVKMGVFEKSHEKSGSGIGFFKKIRSDRNRIRIRIFYYFKFYVVSLEKKFIKFSYYNTIN